MDMNRNWTAFAVEAEYDAYGAARLCAAHNALRFEVESLRMAVNAMHAAMPEPEVDDDVFVQPVPDHCDRITWRNRYYHLPTKVGADGTAKPAAWIRFCSDGCYEGPIADCDKRMDEGRRGSGAWTPLYTIPEGCQLVSIDPTEKMLDAAEAIDWADADIRGNCLKQWHVMLAAALRHNVADKRRGTVLRDGSA